MFLHETGAEDVNITCKMDAFGDHKVRCCSCQNTQEMGIYTGKVYKHNSRLPVHLIFTGIVGRRVTRGKVAFQGRA
jgi:hypothetical protein